MILDILTSVTKRKSIIRKEKKKKYPSEKGVRIGFLKIDFMCVCVCVCVCDFFR